MSSHPRLPQMICRHGFAMRLASRCQPPARLAMRICLSGYVARRISPAEPDRRRAEPPASAGPARCRLVRRGARCGRAEHQPGENGFFGGAEPPAWLRKAEAEPAVEINPTDARSLDWLTKLGAQEEESAAAIAAPSAKLPLPLTPARTAPQLSAIALLDHLAANLYPEAAPLPVPPQQTLLQRIGLERMLYVVLLVVLLTALAVPSLAANLQSPPEAPGAAELFQQIDSLTDKDVVLIGYEWDARRISEMKPLGAGGDRPADPKAG